MLTSARPAKTGGGSPPCCINMVRLLLLAVAVAAASAKRAGPEPGAAEGPAKDERLKFADLKDESLQ